MKYLLILSTLLILGCKKKEDSTPCEITPQTATHLKYFGFTLVDTYWDDPLDTITKSNYVDEVAHFSNVADILVASPTQNIVPNLNKMDSNDLLGILHLFEIFFELVDTNAPSKSNYDLRNDYQQRWDLFIATNNINSNSNKINAFYVGEEPTWNGVKSNELKLACDYIKSTVSDVPIMIIEAYPAIDSIVIPATADWIGLDHYFIKDPFNDPTFLDEYSRLKNKRTSNNQRMVLIMDSHYIPWAHGTFGGISELEMKDVAISYYNLAKQKEEVIALIGYTWPGGLDDPSMKGARQLDQSVINEYIKMGKEITNK